MKAMVSLDNDKVSVEEVTIDPPKPGELKIKAGVQSGQKMRLKGKGMPGHEKGDQLVEILIQTPPADNEKAEKFYSEMQKQFDFNPRSF